jgi:hypothetical protein
MQMFKNILLAVDEHEDPDLLPQVISELAKAFSSSENWRRFPLAV